ASGLYKAAKGVPVLPTADGRAAAATAGEPSLMAIVVSTVVAFGAGYAAIVWVMRIIEHHPHLVVVVYRVLAGVALRGARGCRVRAGLSSLARLWFAVVGPPCGAWAVARPVIVPAACAVLALTCI